MPFRILPKKKQGSTEVEDPDARISFGDAFDKNTSRLMNEDGSYNIVRSGYNVSNIYLRLITMSWSGFFLVILLTYFVINAIFALIYLSLGDCQIIGIPEGSTLETYFHLFYFSIQTFTTVGYGHLSPATMESSFVASIGAFVGLISFAVATGMIFARFSKPDANIRFSKNYLQSPYQDISSLQVRMVHERNSKIIGLEARVIFSYLEEDKKGRNRRKFIRLELEISDLFLFPLNWTLVHPITKDSPLFQASPEYLKSINAEILVLVKGYDEVYGKTVHASKSYGYNKYIRNAVFVPMYQSKKNKTILDLDKIDDYELL